MNTINSIQELKLLELYLNSKADPEYSFALGLVKKGTCFVAVKNGSGFSFYLSHFMGYAKNNMNKRLNNQEKDGKETNPVISRPLGGKPTLNFELEKKYLEYCESLGFVANNKGSFGVKGSTGNIKFCKDRLIRRVANYSYITPYLKFYNFP